MARHRVGASQPWEDKSVPETSDVTNRGTRHDVTDETSDQNPGHRKCADRAVSGEKCRVSTSSDKMADTMTSLFGFRPRDLTSRDALVRLLCRPADPAALGTFRFLFGCLVIIDTFEERGWTRAEQTWGSEDACRFPLFNFLQPLPVAGMYIVYLVMFTGALGITLGFKFRLSCCIYLTTYWYIFFLDKTSWNNHSYLFGIIAFLFSISDANRYWSLDALINPKLNNNHVPLWNYTLIRAQLFLLYFIAGLKKLDTDWMYGYSMGNLASHWVFDPFKLVLTEAQTDLYIVHLGGLVIDLSLGFLLFFDHTRLLGMLISSSFHLMNSQIFSIGMFPYVCMASQLIFCHCDWPRRLFRHVPPSLRLFTPDDLDLLPSESCVYNDKDGLKHTPEESSDSSHIHKSKSHIPTIPNYRHKIPTVFTLVFITWQCFLPYSHGITKGYNNWTNGLYGYSWDMMVHGWAIQHVRVTYVDKDTGESGYLDPNAWNVGDRRRHFSHVDMIKQYSQCVSHHLKMYNIHNVELYFDVWMSLNNRFQQRMVNPNVDIVSADWGPFTATHWLMPLMTGLSDWRTKLDQIERGLPNDTGITHDIVFVADVPGMTLENFVQPDFGNTSLTVLDGEVKVEVTADDLEEGTNVTLGPNQKIQIPANTFHKVHTVSEVPSCYMYIYINTTESQFRAGFQRFQDDVNSSSIDEALKKYKDDPFLPMYQTALETDQEEVEPTMWQRLKLHIFTKLVKWKRCLRLTFTAIYCLATNSSFKDALVSLYNTDVQAVKYQ